MEAPEEQAPPCPTPPPAVPVENTGPDSTLREQRRSRWRSAAGGDEDSTADARGTGRRRLATELSEGEHRGRGSAVETCSLESELLEVNAQRKALEPRLARAETALRLKLTTAKGSSGRPATISTRTPRDIVPPYQLVPASIAQSGQAQSYSPVAWAIRFPNTRRQRDPFPPIDQWHTSWDTSPNSALPTPFFNPLPLQKAPHSEPPTPADSGS